MLPIRGWRRRHLRRRPSRLSKRRPKTCREAGRCVASPHRRSFPWCNFILDGGRTATLPIIWSPGVASFGGSRRDRGDHDRVSLNGSLRGHLPGYLRRNGVALRKSSIISALGARGIANDRMCRFILIFARISEKGYPFRMCLNYRQSALGSA